MKPLGTRKPATHSLSSCDVSKILNPKIYDSIYLRKSERSILDRIDRIALNDELICSFNPTGFIRRRALFRYKRYINRFLANASAPKKKRRLLDIGCGTGKVGLWLSIQTGLGYTGIDFSRVAIRQATTYINKLGMSRSANVFAADFSSNQLPNQSVLVAYSLDAIYLANSPISVLNEISRVLVPGGLLIFTLYMTRKEMIAEWLQLLQRTGFILNRCNNVSAYWRREMRKKHFLRWKQRVLIRQTLGLQGDAELSVTAAMLGKNGTTSYLLSQYRYEIFATKSARHILNRKRHWYEQQYP